MPRHEPFEYSAPPPARGATPLQSIFMGAVGGTVTLVTLVSVQGSPRYGMQLGAFLMTLGILFGIGMVSKSRPVQLIVTMLLIFAGGIAIGLALNVGHWLWYIGAAFFYACAAAVAFKDRIVERSTASRRTPQ